MTKNPRNTVVILMAVLFTVILVITKVAVKGVPNSADSLKYMLGWTSQAAQKDSDSYYSDDTVSYVLKMYHDLDENMFGKVISFRTNDS